MSLYFVAPEASQDLDEISNYFLSRNLEAGERWFQAFNQKCQQLVQFPMMAKSYSTIRFDLRGVPLDGFILLYRVKNDLVEIMRVVSGRRDLDTLFSDSDNE